VVLYKNVQIITPKAKRGPAWGALHFYIKLYRENLKNLLVKNQKA
jgi:hypothetical protein